MVAAIFGNLREAEELLACGADPGLQNSRGKTAADLMSQFINAGIVKQTGNDTFVVQSS